MVKHIAVLTVVVVTVSALAFVTGREYLAYQRREHARVNTANAHIVSQRAETTKNQAALEKRFNDLYAQCKIGETDYNMLPVAVRALKTTVAPVCGLPIVE